MTVAFSKSYTSKPAGKNGFEVNKRVVYSMRSGGQGYSGIQKFCPLMNMPKPMTANLLIKSYHLYDQYDLKNQQGPV